jgi:TIR domain
VDHHSIFICYRRQDSADGAGRLYDRLTQHFGKQSVFKDVDSIPLGVDFRKHLDKKVASCTTLLAVMGRTWLGAASARGTRALDDPGDFVRIEIESALRRGVLVVPVLMQNTTLPESSQLPHSLSELAFRHCIAVRPDPDFHHDVDRLISAIEQAQAQEQAREKQAAVKRDEAVRVEKNRRQEELKEHEAATKTSVLDETPKHRSEGAPSFPRQENEMRAWTEACKLHTYKAYEGYATAFPDGQFWAVAVDRYRKLKPFWKADRF